MLFSIERDYRQYAALCLRAVAGVVFLLHGLSKFGIMGEGNFHETVQFFARMGIPFPDVTAPMLALVEAFGGLALIAGVATRVIAGLLAVVVITEILIIKLPQTINPFAPNGYLFELSLLTALFVLSLVGPGAFALDQEIYPEPARPGRKGLPTRNDLG
jgi:putative oxidoreductase